MLNVQKFRLYFAIVVVAVHAAAQQRFILRTAPGVNAGQLAANYGATVVEGLNEGGGYLVSAPSQVLPGQYIAKVQKDSGVVGFEVDSQVESPESASNSATGASIGALQGSALNRSPMQYFGSVVRAGYVQQVPAVLLRLAQTQRSFGTGSQIVAVIDSGIDPNHPVLKQVLTPGYDFIHNLAGTGSEMGDLTQSTVAILDQDKLAQVNAVEQPVLLNQSTVAILDQSGAAIASGGKIPSDFGHGTMVSGLIHLVAPTARIMPLKAFNANGKGQLSDVIRAIYYAVDNHASVINMSFSLQNQSSELARAVQYATSHRVICVAAGGNSGGQITVYPAGLPQVIGIGSTNDSDHRSGFSNFGVSSVRIAAPGEALLTTYPGNHYAAVWGTSFSTALVSGAVMLISQVLPNAPGENIADALGHGQPLQNQDVGDARLDVYASMLYLLANQ